MALNFFKLGNPASKTVVDKEEVKEDHDLVGQTVVDGDETEEIEDLRTIRRGTNFPESARKSKKRKKTSTIKRNRSHQNMADGVLKRLKKQASGSKSKNSENNTDE